MKRLKLKSWVKNLLLLILFYCVIGAGIFALNWRCGVLNNVQEVSEVSR